MVLRLFFDGACEPVNPNGTASAGWLVKDGEKVIAQNCAVVGSGQGMTNNVAEYSALIEGLRYLKTALHGQKVVIHGDSNLVCSMVGKKWGWNKKKTRWNPHADAPHLRKLLDEALRLLEGVEYEIEWIPREQNREADRLSKLALERAGIGFIERE